MSAKPLQAGDAFGREVDRLRGLHRQALDMVEAASKAATRLTRALERLDRDRMQVVVLGEFSRGKSTFINAILGAQVLPSRVNPTTATINVIAGGPEKQAEIFYTDGNREVVDLSVQKPAKELDRWVTTSNKEAMRIQRVRVTWPCMLSELRAEIVDTPGVNDLDQQREEVTYGYLSKADGAILLLDAQQPLSKSELLFLQDKILPGDIRRILFVLNKIDDLGHENRDATVDRVRRYVADLLTKHVPSLRSPMVHGVSSAEALRARLRGEPAPASSRFESFERALWAFVDGNARADKVARHREVLSGILQDVRRGALERLDMLAGDMSNIKAQVSRLTAEREDIQERLSAAEAMIAARRQMMPRQVAEEAAGQARRRTQQIVARAAYARDDAGFLALRKEIASATRDTVADAVASLTRVVTEVQTDLQTRFSDLLDGPAERSGRREPRPMAIHLPDFDPLLPGVAEAGLGRAFGGGGGGGVALGAFYLASAFLGPVGAIIAAFAAAAACDEHGKQQHAIGQHVARNRLTAELQEAAASAPQVAADYVERSARSYIDAAWGQLRERAQSRAEAVGATIFEGLRVQQAGMAERERQVADSQHNVKRVEALLRQVEESPS